MLYILLQLSGAGKRYFLFSPALKGLKKPVQLICKSISNIERILNAIKGIPEPTYNKAVIFLGTATLIVAVGGILLAAINKTVPDALWTALGAGIGGLAGIFTGKD